MIAVTFLTTVPYLAKHYLWQQYMLLWDYLGWPKWKMFIVFSIAFHTVYVTIMNTVYWLIYRAELPFFEQYKVNSEKWPW